MTPALFASHIALLPGEAAALAVWPFGKLSTDQGQSCGPGETERWPAPLLSDLSAEQFIFS